jgi:hypothetical protein
VEKNRLVKPLLPGSQRVEIIWWSSKKKVTRILKSVKKNAGIRIHLKAQSEVTHQENSVGERRKTIVNTARLADDQAQQ